MARKNNLFRNFSVNYFLIHLVLIAGLTFLLSRLLHTATLVVPAITAVSLYLAYSVMARYLILSHHQRGMKFFHQKHYQGAIKGFEQSLQFLKARPWVDKYRWLVLLSTSKLSYREMAMFNIGAAYVYLRSGPQARQAFEAFLAAFPASTLAATARKLMLTLEAQKKQK